MVEQAVVSKNTQIRADVFIILAGSIRAYIRVLIQTVAVGLLLSLAGWNFATYAGLYQHQTEQCLNRR